LWNVSGIAVIHITVVEVVLGVMMSKAPAGRSHGNKCNA